MTIARLAITACTATAIAVIATPAFGQFPPPELRPGDEYRVIFVTSTTSDGNLGRIGGADELVNLATQRSTSLIRDFSFRALVSTDTVDAIERFPGDFFPVYNTRGELVADRLSDLLDGADTELDNRVWYDETGGEISSSLTVWTGTTADGEATTLHCHGWTTDSSGSDATIGHPDLTDEQWVNGGTLNCSNRARLYGLSDPIEIKGPELFVPAAASALGQAGTHWTTSGWFLNLTPTTVTVRGAFLQQGRSNLGVVRSPITIASLPPLAFLEVADIVKILGGSGKAGALYFTFEPLGQIQTTDMVRVTTYTSTPNHLGDGAYGQGIPAVTAGIAEGAYVSGLFQNAVHRTNLGVVNTSGERITLRIEFSDAGGLPIGVAVEWILEPYEHRQRGLPDLGVSQIDGGGARITLHSAEGSFRAYTSTVDQITGDAAYNAAQ